MRTHLGSSLRAFGPVLVVLVLGTLVVAGASGAPAPGISNEVPYPHGFRDWTHVKTGLAGPASATFATRGGFHHIYANDAAVEGYRTGKFPDGAVIAFDVLMMVDDGKGSIREGERRLVDVMVKDSAKYASTGGWGFEEFLGNSTSDGKIGAQATTLCFNCHAALDKSDFVVSVLRK